LERNAVFGADQTPFVMPKSYGAKRQVLVSTMLVLKGRSWCLRFGFLFGQQFKNMHETTTEPAKMPMPSTATQERRISE
jgi:hypothetical protein